MGGAFEVSYAGNEFSLQITGQGGSYPLPAGTTSTNVVVDVQTGNGTVRRNANVGTVNNSQINASAAAITAIASGPTGTDEQYVATQMLLLTPGAFASSDVALSNVANPYALPNVTMNQLFQAGNVAMKRLMQLRESNTPTPAAPLLSSKGGLTDQESLTAGSAVVTGNSFTSFGAPLNGPTPDDGARWWSRGYGFTNSVSDDTWAKTSYSSATGGLMFGADMVLGKGFIAGAFIGYMPGTVDITGGLVDETDTINGANVGIYGSWVPDSGKWYVEAAAQGGYAGVDRTRELYIPGVVRTANSDNSLWAASVNSEIGMNIRIGGDMFVQPYAGVAAGYVGQSSYTEQGAGSANLDVSSQSAVMLQPTIGSRIMHTLRIDRDVLTPYIGSAFIASVPIGDWDVTATNAYSATPGYSVYGSPETRYGASFEAGVEFASYKGITAYCSFNGMQFENEQQYGGQIGVIVPF
jgi:outer membrane autotransporter protein